MIAEAFLRGAVVFLIAGLLTVVLAKRSAALRHHIWAAAILIQLALLAFIPVLPSLSVPLIDSPSTVPAALVPGRDYSVAEFSPGSPPAIVNAMDGFYIDWGHLLPLIWGLGAALILLRYLIGTLMMMRLAHKSRRVEEGEWLTLAQRVANELGITRPVTLVWGNKLAVPITWGVLYPMILLPESANEWPAERRRFVLVHEMAHVRRFDALTQVVAQVTLAVFWFSPFLWLAEWRLRVEREHACDDVVLNHGTEPTLYADELLQMVRSLVTRKRARPAFAALAMARRSEFEGRMLAILDPARRRSAAEIGSALAFIALSLFIAAPLAALDPFHTDAAVAAVVSQEPDIVTLTGPGSMYACTAADLRAPGAAQTNAMTMVHGHTDEDPALSYTEVKIVENDRCVVGMVKQDRLVRLHEVTRDIDRIAELAPLPERYTVNGVPAALDRGWVAQWRPLIVSTVQKQQAAETSKSRAKREPQDTTMADIINSFASIASDTEKRNALKAQLHGASKSMLIKMVTVAASMDSGYELSGFLIEASPFMLTRDDNELEAAWFDVAGTLTSSIEHRNALMAAVAHAHGNRRMQGRIAQSAARMSSATDKAAVLTALAAVR